jgi:hypothetical protein
MPHDVEIAFALRGLYQRLEHAGRALSNRSRGRGQHLTQLGGDAAPSQRAQECRAHTGEVADVTEPTEAEEARY